MDTNQVRIVSDAEAIRNVLRERQRYAFYIGAGASAEAGVPAADAICQKARADLLAAAGIDPEAREARERWANEFLSWGDTTRRYVTCIREWLPNEATRVEHFRRLLADTGPSFCHHAVALLMSRGYLQSTCLTTNFDHLLERAFSDQAIAECQAIRSESEARYWENRSDRYYVVKLHGDIDTLNVLNTREETIAIRDELVWIVDTVTRAAGLVVLGTAGNEKSIRALFDHLGRRSPTADASLSFGLLWGVYMASPKPVSLSSAELNSRVLERISEGEVNREIVEIIADSRNDLFCFFPVWSSGDFMRDLVVATRNMALVSLATQHLDHDMRLRHLFSNAGFPESAVTRHIDALRRQRASLKSSGA